MGIAATYFFVVVLQLTEDDEYRYESFNTVVGAHWQFEMMG